MEVNDCDALLRQVMGQAAALKIPFSKAIDPHVIINTRAVTRFGCCVFDRKTGGFRIEVARRVAEGPEEGCRETLAHELLHTCYGCRNHGKRWKGYAAKMNEAYGYAITRATTNEALGVKGGRPYRYLFRCDRCGAEFGRYRASALTRHPERYRCGCGGRLERQNWERDQESP